MKTAILTLLAILMTTPIAAAPLGIILQSDGPWIDLPQGVNINTAAPSLTDIVQMADLDGDPMVTTQKEAQMIALLSSVLLGHPVSR
mgnify:CR=1 FL=1